ncbi:hypothetical protein NDU88_005484 [Pleurodeles waltl]|uniref:Uncharacterized protein n=1 Tax=Pleurodeles waltl TaxID=8319 RepID=A0AAV7PMT0_PLEWA|nr:hypothetical protein NDU88_005484 [Pleurodeles waltl]
MTLGGGPVGRQTVSLLPARPAVIGAGAAGDIGAHPPDPGCGTDPRWPLPGSVPRPETGIQGRTEPESSFSLPPPPLWDVASEGRTRWGAAKRSHAGTAGGARDWKRWHTNRARRRGSGSGLLPGTALGPVAGEGRQLRPGRRGQP